jgi:hypothetical protein
MAKSLKSMVDFPATFEYRRVDEDLNVRGVGYFIKNRQDIISWLVVTGT